MQNVFVENIGLLWLTPELPRNDRKNQFVKKTKRSIFYVLRQSFELLEIIADSCWEKSSV